MSRRAVWRLSAAMVLFEELCEDGLWEGLMFEVGPAGNNNHSLILITATPRCRCLEITIGNEAVVLTFQVLYRHHIQPTPCLLVCAPSMLFLTELPCVVF